MDFCYSPLCVVWHKLAREGHMTPSPTLLYTVFPSMDTMWYQLQMKSCVVQCSHFVKSAHNFKDYLFTCVIYNRPVYFQVCTHSSHVLQLFNIHFVSLQLHTGQYYKWINSCLYASCELNEQREVHTCECIQM